MTKTGLKTYLAVTLSILCVSFSVPFSSPLLRTRVTQSNIGGKKDRFNFKQFSSHLEQEVKNEIFSQFDFTQLTQLHRQTF